MNKCNPSAASSLRAGQALALLAISGLGGGQPEGGLALGRHVPVYIDQCLHILVAGGGVGDDYSAVGMPCQDDGSVNGGEEVGQGLAVVGNAAQRVGWA
jgi:hypothetical protein